MLAFSVEANARICFLPGDCFDEIRDAIRDPQNKQCLGYTLTEAKCTGSDCGWDCESCTNKNGTFYKCTEKAVPDSYIKGVDECPLSCYEYTYGGRSGNKVYGKCTLMEGYSTKVPAHCTTYVNLPYNYGVSISGGVVTYLQRSDCYYNVVPLETSGGERYVISRPGADDQYCYTYNSSVGTDGTTCYANKTLIDTLHTSGSRNLESHKFDIIKNYDKTLGTSTKECYQVLGCNTDNGWQPAEEVDTSKFAYDEVIQDGVTCRKKNGCIEGYTASGDTCVKPCTGNSDCNSGEYCRITKATTNGSCDTSNESYFTSLKGTCTDLGTVNAANINGVATTYSSTEYFNWWNAYNWCAAQGLRLWTRDELSCSNFTEATSINYCCMSGTDASSCKTASTQSTTMHALQEFYKSSNVYHMWLNDSYGTNLGQNSCYAFYANPDVGSVHYYPRGIYYTNYAYYAVCHAGCGSAYRLDECPEGGICSKCKNNKGEMKYKLDECSQGYTQNGLICEANACPDNSATTAANCGDGTNGAEGWTLGSGTGSYSGSEECKQCVANECSGYDIEGKCPTNGDCKECKQGDKKVYDLIGCTDTNYKVNDAGDACVLKGCSDYEQQGEKVYDSCTATSCYLSSDEGADYESSSSYASTYVTCVPYTMSSGLICYTKNTQNCDCSKVTATSPYLTEDYESCTNGQDESKSGCGVTDDCYVCADGEYSYLSRDMCNPCDTTEFNLTSEPANANYGYCYDGSAHYRYDSCKQNYTPTTTSSGKECECKYKLETCPEGGICSTCIRDGKEYHTLLSCKVSGYVKNTDNTECIKSSQIQGDGCTDACLGDSSSAFCLIYNFELGYDGSSCSEEHGNYYYNLQGRCKGTLSGTTASLSGVNVLISSRSDLNWWSAYNWCAAHGYRLLTRDDLSCSNDISGEESDDFCCKYETNCSSEDNDETSFSEIIVALASNASHVWLSDSYHAGLDSNSCYALRTKTDGEDAGDDSEYNEYNPELIVATMRGTEGKAVCFVGCDESVYSLDSCPENGTCSSCGGKYKLNSCEYGYTKDGNECKPASCASGYATDVSKCGTSGGWSLGTKFSGMSGNNKCYKCVANECSGYDLTSCPTNGSCSECQKGDTKVLKLDSCNTGYTKSGNSCVPTPYIVDEGCGSCTSTQYCKIISWQTKGDISDNNNDCWTNKIGTCTDIGDGSSTTVNGMSITVSSGGGFNWWSAFNWCIAQGNRLLTLDELSCSNIPASAPIGVCCKSGTDCSVDDSVSISTTMNALQMLRFNYNVQGMWLNTSYASTMGGNSCYAYIADLFNEGFIIPNVRKHWPDSNYAVCVGACEAGYNLSDCPTNGNCSYCGGRYKLEDCQDGYVVNSAGNACVTACDSDYYLSVCPANGICDDCTDNSQKFKLESCKEGYLLSQDACIQACDTSIYTLDACPTGGQCMSCSDTSTHHELKACNAGYTMDTDPVTNKLTCVKTDLKVNKGCGFCGDNEYCKITSWSPAASSCVTEYGSLVGTCEKVDAAPLVSPAWPTITYSKTGDFNWWSAYNWCAAQDMSLWRLDDLVCPDTSAIAANGQGPCVSLATSFLSTGIAGAMWLQQSYQVTASQNSCRAFAMTFTDLGRYVTSPPRPNSSNFYAACRACTELYKLSSCPTNGMCQVCNNGDGTPYFLRECEEGYKPNSDYTQCVCDSSIYTLDTCPVGGDCSYCGGKYKLNSCEEGYTKNGDTCEKDVQIAATGCEACTGKSDTTYCRITNWTTSGICNINSNGNFYVSLEGSCQEIGEVKPVTPNPYPVNDMAITYSSNTVSSAVSSSTTGGFNWWSAYNWCAAQGKRLLTLDELSCSNVTTETESSSNVSSEEGPGYCYASGETLSVTVQALMSSFNNADQSVWLNDSYGTDLGQNSCQALSVHLRNGNVTEGNRDNTFIAMCIGGCNTSVYKLSSCPANGSCSYCGGKYRLDSCASGYTLSEDTCVETDCKAGYATSVGKCGNKGIVGWTWNCDSLTGGGISSSSGNSFCCKCVANTCSGYNIEGDCPEHGTCSSSCYKGDSEVYKLDSCASGYEPNSDGTECVETGCKAGYATMNTMATCGMSGAIGWTLDKSSEGNGIINGYKCYKCVAKECDEDFKQLLVRSDEGTYKICYNGDTPKYKLTSCADGYEPNAQGTTCVEASCENGYTTKSDCTKSGSGYSWNSSDCFGKNGENACCACVANTCDGYGLTGCPDNGICETCISGASTKYKLTSCKAGYNLENGVCVRDWPCGNNCKSGQYCKVKSVTTSGSCSATSNSNYYTSLTGECTALGTVNTATINGVATTYSSAGNFNWWSAKYWCEAQNMRLWTVDELSCENLSAVDSKGSCCKSGTSCNSTDSTTISDTMLALVNNVLGSGKIMWLEDSYARNLGPNSCGAYVANNIMSITNSSRTTQIYGYMAVCVGGSDSDKCKGYTLTQCPDKGTCLTCNNNGTLMYKLNACKTGYEPNTAGTACIVNPCDGYTLTTEPANASYKTCVSGSTTKYMITSCNSGYKLNYANTACEDAYPNICGTCPSGKYCKITLAENNGNRDCTNGTLGDYWTELVGYCEDIGDINSSNITGTTITWKSNYPNQGANYDFNWWSAYNWCAAQGLSLWSEEYLNCGTLTEEGYCCKDSSCSNDSMTQSITMRNLRGVLSNLKNGQHVGHMWLLETGGVGDKSCMVKKVNLYTGAVTTENRSYNGANSGNQYYYPVCIGS